MKELVFPEGVTPKFPLKLSMTFEFDCWSCPEATTTLATFTYSDCTCTVNDGDKEAGEITCGIGGHFMLRDTKRHLTYVLKPDKAWYAFQSALEDKQKKGTK